MAVYVAFLSVILLSVTGFLDTRLQEVTHLLRLVPQLYVLPLSKGMAQACGMRKGPGQTDLSPYLLPCCRGNYPTLCAVITPLDDGARLDCPPESSCGLSPRVYVCCMPSFYLLS